MFLGAKRGFQEVVQATPSLVRFMTEGSALTRQGITKHLRILEKAGIVHCVRIWRESRFELNPAPITEVKEYLDQVSKKWDEALSRLAH